MGWSNGRWEGETLVIDVTALDDRTWFDRAGNHHSIALHVVERYTPRSADTLMYEATIEDPKVFSRPWKISMPCIVVSRATPSFWNSGAWSLPKSCCTDRCVRSRAQA